MNSFLKSFCSRLLRLINDPETAFTPLRPTPLRYGSGTKPPLVKLGFVRLSTASRYRCCSIFYRSEERAIRPLNIGLLFARYLGGVSFPRRLGCFKSLNPLTVSARLLCPCQLFETFGLWESVPTSFFLLKKQVGYKNHPRLKSKR